MKLGLKLWATNTDYIEEARELFYRDIYQYIELFSVPRSYEGCGDAWKELSGDGVPFIIHAPHSFSGLNFARKEQEKENGELAQESFRYADDLDAEYIIFHPGINGDETETIRQMKMNFDERMLIENKPYKCINNMGTCNGWSASAVKMIMDELGIGLCLDFGHAFCAANSMKQEPFEYLKGFQNLNPTMYHLTDGDYQAEIDSHLNIGLGDYPIKDIVKTIEKNKMLTLETAKRNGLEDFVSDVGEIRQIENE